VMREENAKQKTEMVLNNENIIGTKSRTCQRFLMYFP
jgi:hypothetical protein